MVMNESLTTIIHTLAERQLGKAIEQMENYLAVMAQPQAIEQLLQLKTDYELMCDYWLKGFDDPQRETLYDQLLRKMYVLTMNVCIRTYLRNSTFVSNTYSRVRNGGRDWTPAGLRRIMEEFVSDVALLDLEPEHIRKEKLQKVYDLHLGMMSDLFDYIWTSKLWSDGVTEAFTAMLLSPTLDTIDQQILVSAITLSTINFFGINKFRLLMTVYRESADEHVRQRALIGWVLSLETEAYKLYPEVHDMISEVTEDPRCCDELAELQFQLMYCLKTESDTQKIQTEIMPDLIKNNSLRVTLNGIEEVEDDPLDDVLHPELSEQRMERLEESVRKMVDMQRQGSDIFFGGFSQMKRFPFFQVVVNWFIPFFPQHPVVSIIVGRVRGSKFINTLITTAPFCDSDKYSFVIGYEQTVSRMPENLLSMLDRGEATVIGGEMGPEELQSPAFLRRSYLQGMYRFYKVFPVRSEFINPFGDATYPRYVFFAHPAFRQTKLESRFGQAVAFFMKHGFYEAAKATLQNYSDEARDAQFYLLNGRVLMRTRDASNAGLTAVQSFERLLQLDPENERGWAGYARALFEAGDYSLACQYYRRLMEKHDDNRNYQLNVAVCLTNMNDYEAALKLLYKLNYEAPDDNGVNRVLAWALVGAAKYEQALKIYDRLLDTDTPDAEDLLNAAYAHWFARQLPRAIHLFRRYASLDSVTFNPDHEFLVAEQPMIARHGITPLEIQLMIAQL